MDGAMENLYRKIAAIGRRFRAERVVLFGSRARGDNRSRSDIDIAVTGVEDFDTLAEAVDELPTLYSVDLLNLDTCKNQLLLEDIKQYGREI